MTTEYMEKNDFHRKFAFSPAVITKGGRTVWLAGAIALRDESGKDISGQFEPQVRAIFDQMDKQLREAGGSLANLVTMTVFVADAGNVPSLVAVRKELFKEEKYPASTLIAGSGFALPGIVVEIQGIAVIDDD